MNADNRFLASVAKYYFENRDRARTCLIFPNKRSAIFFRQYFKALVAQAPGCAVVAPSTTTIGAFLEQHSELEGISNVEALFELYDAYRAVAQQHKADVMGFDRFIFWGRMLINDFEDIDAALADASMLYKNLVDLKEISSNFLTDEQLEVLQYVFGKNMVDHYKAGDTGEFWRHISHDKEKSAAHTRFVELWMLLGDIYKEYRRRLVARGCGYPSMMARNVCEQLKNGSFIMPYVKVAFVGFNAPSMALTRIMQLLDIRGRAEFFWDVLPDDVMAQQARKRVARLAAQFKMPNGFVAPEVHRPQVDVRAVPSDSMQAKEAIARLQALKEAKVLDTERPDNTAVVLPDPNLLPDLLQSMPADFGKLNVTMGLPMRNTFFASVMRNIVNLQINIDMRHGMAVFRSEDVRAIVSNPRLIAVAHAACSAVLTWLDKKHTYMVSANELASLLGAEVLSPIFKNYEEDSDRQSYDAICQYFDNVIALFETVKGTSAADRQERSVVDAWRNALNTVVNLSQRYNVSVNDKQTFFSLLWRIISSDEMHVSSSPVTGLQVMGMLETRNLDFDNVIVLSVNENVCPPRHARRTFIPAMLRKDFALPVDEDYALEYDYYFYRLLSHADRVTFIYDSRAATRRNARSHLIDQMVFMRPDDLKMTITPVHSMPVVPPKRVFSVVKSDRVMAQVDKLREYDSKVNLSASAIKIYRKCPLRFYLSTVCGVRESDEPEDYMSFSMYGSVVHRVLEDIFMDMRQKGTFGKNGVLVTAPMIVWEMDETRLLHRVRKVINEMYHNGHYPEDQLDKLPGESRLLAQMMRDYVQKVLEKELETVKKDGPFEFVDAEEKYKSAFDSKTLQRLGEQMNFGKDVYGNDLNVNFSLSIDRHDVLPDGRHRFIDYKTGKDKSVVKSLADLFDHNSEGNDAALQLWIYAEAYLANYPTFNGEIVPAVYKLREAFTGDMLDDVISLHIGSGKSKEIIPLIWSLGSEMRGEFVDRLNKLVQEIFDPRVPFYQADNSSKCTYCPFVDMCMRTSKEY